MIVCGIVVVFSVCGGFGKGYGIVDMRSSLLIGKREEGGIVEGGGGGSVRSSASSAVVSVASSRSVTVLPSGVTIFLGNR